MFRIASALKRIGVRRAPQNAVMLLNPFGFFQNGLYQNNKLHMNPHYCKLL